MNSFIEIAIGTTVIVVGMTLLLALAAYAVNFLFFKKKR